MRTSLTRHGAGVLPHEPARAVPDTGPTARTVPSPRPGGDAATLGPLALPDPPGTGALPAAAGLVDELVLALAWEDQVLREDRVAPRTGVFAAHRHQTLFEVTLHQLLADVHAGTGAPVRVLDAGCGAGRLVEVLARAGVPVHLTLMDTSVSAVDAASRRAAAAGLDYGTVGGDPQDLAPGHAGAGLTVGARPGDRDAAGGELAEAFDLVVSVRRLAPALAPGAPRGRVARHLAGLRAALAPTGTLLAVLPSFEAYLEPDELTAARAGAARGGVRPDRRWRSADLGAGIAQCLHDADTIAAEFPAAGLAGALHAVPLRYAPTGPVDPASAGLYGGWDWMVCTGRS